MEFGLAIYAAAAGLALVQAVLLTLQTWEHRRFARGRLAKLKAAAPPGRVLLLAPCKGLDAGLADNLRPLFEQDHPNYELALIVESATDPAAAIIRQLLAEHPRVSARLVIAGQAKTGGQKVHNLLAATADLSGEVRYLAFVDSDARPRPEWLRQLVQRLGEPKNAASTAYRWFIPARRTLANYLLYSVNSAVAMFVGPSKHKMVWGGSWAIRRDAFDETELREAWQGTLSDDLVAARVLQASGSRAVEFEPACMAASPLDMSLGQVAEFITRQYTIGRRYSPRWWWGALAFNTLTQAVFWGSLAWALCSSPKNGLGFWLPAGIFGAMYSLGTIRAWLRQDAARIYLPHWRSALGTARRFDLWFHPLGGLANWLGLVLSSFGSRIAWRGIRYQILRGGQARILSAPHDVSVPAPMSGIATTTSSAKVT